MIFKITNEHSGRSLLSFLRSTLHISSSALAALKRDPRGLEVNGVHVTVRYVLKENDVLFVNEEDSSESVSETIIPVNISINTVFENDDVILIDKPANMPTHPSHGHVDDTLANALAYVFMERKRPFVFRPIGRLDRNTSGISLIAKHQISASFLFFARQKHLISKKYIAILEGRVDSDGSLQVIDNYMKRSDDSIIVRCVSSPDEEGSFRAITHWRLLFANDEISVVEAIPQTGRTHQLRVHFSHMGHPILGDDVYGRVSDVIDRHALHAASLSLPIPYCENDIEEFVSLPPEDMVRAAKEYGCNLVAVFNEKFNSK